MSEESRPATRLPELHTLGHYPEPTTNPGFVLQRLSEVEPRNVRWLLPGLIPLRTLTLVAGVGGLGKSMWLAGVAARLSRGELKGHEPADTVIVSYEDTAAEVLRPRIEAAGGDPARVHVVVREHRDYVDPVAFPKHVLEVEEMVLSVQAKLLVIDPVVAGITVELDTHKDQHVRAVLALLAQLSEEANCAVAMVCHLNKAPSTDAYIRVANSVAFWNASRSVVLVTEDNGDDDLQLIAQRKANYARLSPVERHRVEPVVLTHLIDPEDGRPVETARMVFLETAADVDGAHVLGPKTTKTETAETLLEAILADGEWHEGEGVKKLMKAGGFSERTTKRAAQQVGVGYERRGYPAMTWWRLPIGQVLAGPSTSTKVGPTVETPIASDSRATSGPVGPSPDVEEDGENCDALVLRLIPENAKTEAALFAEVEEFVAEGIGTIVESGREGRASWT